MTIEFITEVKADLFGSTKEFLCQVAERDSHAVSVLYKVPETRRLGSLLLPIGTITFGYFREDRYYNVYHFVTPAGSTLATYFNVSDQTRVTDAAINWRDLVIDILVTPRHGCEVLDEDELPADLDPALGGLIATTRDYIVQHHQALVQAVERTSAAYLSALNPGRP